MQISASATGVPQEVIMESGATDSEGDEWNSNSNNAAVPGQSLAEDSNQAQIKPQQQ